MIVLTNCLSKKVDEGALKVANSLVKRIKDKQKHTIVVSYDRTSDLSDVHLKLNKLLLNRKLFSFLKKKNENVLYIPFPAREWATALRIFILSRICKKELCVLLVMKCRLNALGRQLLRLSGAEFLALSQEAFELYASMVGRERVKYLKTGVDTKKFVPVSKERSRLLKQKYGFDPDKKLILHVGHLNNGRNVGELCKISDTYSVLLVVSTLTKSEQDLKLKEALLRRKNLRIMESYLPCIEEIYQMADAYIFPVQSAGHCIDVPLSCLEAAACNKPIITTDYGEMSAFRGKNGFYFIQSFEADLLDRLLDQAIHTDEIDTRDAVLSYDWDHAISYLAKM